jgi:hypothetical protein
VIPSYPVFALTLTLNTACLVAKQRNSNLKCIVDPLLTAIQTNLPLFLMLGFILYVIQTTKNIVYEKERKLKVSLNNHDY